MSIRAKIEGILCVLPATIWLLVVTGWPLFEVLRLSLFKFDLSIAQERFIGFQNYKAVLSDPTFVHSLKNTTLFALTTVVLHIIIGISLALLLNAPIPGTKKLRNILRGIFVFPWLFATVAAASLWILVLRPFGLADHVLMSLGLINQPQNFLGNPSLAMPTVLAMNLWKTYPLVMIMILSGLQSVPHELHEAAKIDGANVFQGFFYITLPLLKGILLTVTLLDTIWMFKIFDLVYLTTGGGPLEITELLPLTIYRQGFLLLKFGYAACLGMILFFVVAAINVIYLIVGRARR